MHQGRMLIAAVLFVAVASLPALAVPIEYVFTGTGTGSVGQTDFIDAQFEIRVAGDTGGRYSGGSGIFLNDALTAVVTVLGIGSFNVTEPTRVFVNNNNDAVGFNSLSEYDLYDLVDMPSLVLSDYDLISPYALETGSSNCCAFQWDALQTDGGAIGMDSFGPTGTFEATVAPVPEPETLLLLGSGLVGLVARRRRAS